MAISNLDGFSSLPEWHEFFRTLFPKQTRKHVAAVLGVPERRAKDLLETKARPRADEIFRMAVASADARAALFKMFKETRRVEQKARGHMHSNLGALVGRSAVAHRNDRERDAVAVVLPLAPRRQVRAAPAYQANAARVTK